MRRTTPIQWLVLFAALVMLAAPTIASARAWLGVTTQDVTRDLRDALDLPEGGVLVTRVVSDSPADRAGIASGDVILSVDGRGVDSPSELAEAIGDSREGESVSLRFVHKGERRTLSVRLGTRDDEDFSAPEPPVPPTPRAAPAPKAPRAPRHEMRWYSSDDKVDPDEIRDRVRDSMKHFEFRSPDGDGPGMAWIGSTGRGRLGVRIETVTEDLASALGAASARGALVLEVIEGTPAAKAGVRAGDIITGVEGSSVDDAEDLRRELRNREGRVSLSIVRRGERQTISTELEDSPRVIRVRDGQMQGLKGLEKLKDIGRMGDDGKYEVRIKGDADDEELRRELDQLREELRALRRELQDRR